MYLVDDWIVMGYDEYDWSGLGAEYEMLSCDTKLPGIEKLNACPVVGCNIFHNFGVHGVQSNKNATHLIMLKLLGPVI